MADRKKVIEGLGRISEWLFQQYRVVYDGDAPNYYDAYKTVDEAIELLKEQETVVRCKDCTFRNEINCPLYYRRSELTDNWFCADGEWKET